MKKVIITALTIVTTMALSTSVFAFANTSKKTEISKEELEYSKAINPNITESELKFINKQRDQLDKLHKQLEKLELDYGILVDNTKDPNKEPTKSVNDLTAKERKNYLELLNKIWDGEIQFLDAQYKVGLIKEDIYKEDKKNFEEIKETVLNNR